MSIQSQIDAAASGATVTIAPGTYRENVNIGKALTLRGHGAIIRPSGGWNAISKGEAGGWCTGPILRRSAKDCGSRG